MLLLSSNSSAAQAQAARSCISFLIRGIRIIREGKDYYYLIYQGEIQRYLGSRQDTDTDGDCGKNALRQDASCRGRASADIGRQTC
jgi:hypothetical protein